jgi:hypothetical protein
MGLVGGEGFAVDASLIQADASDRSRVDGAAGVCRQPPPVVRSTNILPPSMMRHSVQKARLRRNSLRRQIRQRGGRRRTVDRRSLPIRATT